MRDRIGTVAVASPPPEAVVPSHQLFSIYLSPVTSPEGTYSDELEEPVPVSVTSISPLTEGAGSQTRTPYISATSSLTSTPLSSRNTGQTRVPLLDLSSRQASTPVTSTTMATVTTVQTSDCAQALDLNINQAIDSIPTSRAAMTSGTPDQTSVPITSSTINSPMDLRSKSISNEGTFQDEP
jgi:hypothetical protein